MNRDEAHSRPPAREPQYNLQHRKTNSALPSRSSRRHMVWLQPFGLVLALLNYNPTTVKQWQSSTRKTTTRSRGLIIPELLQEKSAQEAAARGCAHAVG